MNLNVLLRGQSNAYLLGTFVGDQITHQVQTMLGFDGVTDTVSLEFAANASANTAVSGTAFLGQWLAPTAAGGWQVAELEQGLLNYVAALPAVQQAQPTAVVWLHSEYDSAAAVLSPATWESAVRTDAALLRAAFGQSAAQLPYLFVSAIPYGQGNDAGHQAIRIGMEELAADPVFNGGIAARVQDTDMAWDGAGEFGGAHQSWGDLQITAARIAASLAQEWSAFAKPGSSVALAGGAVDDLGPQVVAAHAVAPNQVVMQVQFDTAGTLVAPDATAAAGTGWLVRNDGGPTVRGVAAAELAPDTLLVTFDGALPAGGRLYYGYGYGRLAASDGSGEHHAIYDNNGQPIWVDAHGLAIGGVAPAAAPVAVGGAVLVGTAGGSYAGSAGADDWIVQPGSAHSVIQGFDANADLLTFSGVAPGSLTSWTAALDGTVAGLVIAWGAADAYVFLPGIARLPESQILFA